MKKTLVSGIQASGTLHLGNYFGAMKQNVEIGNDDAYDAYVFIADYHALTSQKDPKALAKSSFDIAAAYLAAGLDPKKVTLFRQSAVPAVTELAWIMNTVTPMPMLELAHAYKAKLDESEKHDINAGIFDYPVLMAADILLYGGETVPVGKDQEQHLEIAREIAGKFNRAWKTEFFRMPKSFTPAGVAIVPGTDGAKMSKSKGNVIPLFGSDVEIKKAVMAVVTDSKLPEEPKDPDTNNIYNIHKLFLSPEEDTALRERYEKGGLSYKDAKEGLLASIIDFVAPMRERYEHYQANPAEVETILADGARRAGERGGRAIGEVRRIVGLDA